MPTGVYPRSIEYRRKMAEVSWRHQHEKLMIWNKPDEEEDER